MSSSAPQPANADPASRDGFNLRMLGDDMLKRKAMVLQDEQLQRYFPNLQARGWHLRPGEPSSTLEKHFDFSSEDKLASWTAQMLAYMQRANHHAQLKIMYKSVDVQTNTHRAYTPKEPKLARPALSNKDIQLAYHAEQLLEESTLPEAERT
ncbi:hypothetical protein PENSPDRAFT_688591 [Peniophora sp. CONT]|nr:hypothetical protein PENSPDRAFT_688591 [Peniophora sp. CONT]